MHAAKTQEQQKTEDSLQYPTIAFPGEEVPAQTIPEHSRKGGIQRLPAADGDTSQDMVSGALIGLESLWRVG